jgi:hypothetical protein
MALLKFAILAGGLLAAPLAAQSVSDTHEMRWAPAGKVPSVTFHPLKRCGPSTAPHHISGKSAQFVTLAPKSDCAERIAAKEQDRKDRPTAQN